jgi:hypothetical protein
VPAGETRAPLIRASRESLSERRGANVIGRGGAPQGVLGLFRAFGFDFDGTAGADGPLVEGS